MTYIIATLKAWKLFLLLTSAVVLMFLLMQYGGLGFVVAGVTIFFWMFSMSVELAKINTMKTTKYTVSFLMGTIATVTFVLVPFGSVIAGKVLASFIGLILLANMMYLMFAVGSLLAVAEKNGKLNLNATWLVYAWPIGVWYLQPRLQKVLCK